MAAAFTTDEERARYVLDRVRQRREGRERLGYQYLVPEPPAGPRGVDGSVPCDGEQPGAELVGAVLLELRQVTDHLEPGLGGDVLDVVAADYPQVAQQRWLQWVSEHQEAGLVARPGVHERLVERGHARSPHPLLVSRAGLRTRNPPNPCVGARALHSDSA